MSNFAPRPVSFNPAPKSRKRHTTHPRPRPKPIPKPKPRPAGNPRNTWPSWTDRVRFTINVSNRNIDPPAFVPTPASEAFNCGWNLGYEHDRSAAPSSDLTPALALSWRAGWAAGWASRDEVDALIDRRQAELSDPVGGGVRETDGYTPGYYS